VIVNRFSTSQDYLAHDDSLSYGYDVDEENHAIIEKTNSSNTPS